MRKKEKYIVQGALLGFVGTALIDVLMQWSEHVDRGKKFTWGSYDGLRTLKNGVLGGSIGAGIGYLAYEYQSILDQEKFFSSDEYLKSILRDEDLKTNPELLNAAILVRDELKMWAVDNFSEKLIALPQNTGSFTKRTANVSSFDIDIILPFKKQSFSNLEEMFNWTYEKLHHKFSNKANVTKGTKAINISIEKHGHTFNFDIVPGREIANYKLDKRLNLYVNPKKIWKRGSSFKIDASKQRSITINKPEERRVIRLLKIYNEINSLKIPSVIIEQSVVVCFSSNNCGTNSSLTDNLLKGMDHLAEKLGQESFIDYSNSNNNLLNKIDWNSRSKAIQLIRKDTIKISTNPCYLREVFDNE